MPISKPILKHEINSTFENVGGVYFIRSLISDDLYIGSAMYFKYRYLSHLAKMRISIKGDMPTNSSLLYKFVAQRGIESLIFLPYAVCDNVLISKKMELDLIDELNPSLNIIRRGVSGRSIFIQDTKRNIQ